MIMSAALAAMAAMCGCDNDGPDGPAGKSDAIAVEPSYIAPADMDAGDAVLTVLNATDYSLKSVAVDIFYTVNLSYAIEPILIHRWESAAVDLPVGPDFQYSHRWLSLEYAGNNTIKINSIPNFEFESDTGDPATISPTEDRRFEITLADNNGNTVTVKGGVNGQQVCIGGYLDYSPLPLTGVTPCHLEFGSEGGSMEFTTEAAEAGWEFGRIYLYNDLRLNPLLANGKYYQEWDARTQAQPFHKTYDWLTIDNEGDVTRITAAPNLTGAERRFCIDVTLRDPDARYFDRYTVVSGVQH